MEAHCFYNGNWCWLRGECARTSVEESRRRHTEPTIGCREVRYKGIRGTKCSNDGPCPASSGERFEVFGVAAAGGRGVCYKWIWAERGGRCACRDGVAGGRQHAGARAVWRAGRSSLGI